ncbi:heme lyase CcmF/NrfE family subunit [Allopusillimonas ginsengisoli]|uniref:heme lyase CcmF/NrfE family subunit n=1 Tax=Allopusillimonas ginsengisoli TaxID=453575 RepID=UPI001022767A|nr:heme lyase CcmF/NrfE family subunit [Allopusillimonas ginsengisoli]TEA78986.1 heme lyase CcmF/NrfE family subunit [Allopusillimonas ginsengisoli]
MIPEIGHFALILALLLTSVQVVLPMWGVVAGRPAWVALARPAAAGQTLFIILAFACLIVSFLVNDFSVIYVIQHSNTALPWGYRLAAVWGGHEGSILLWLLILSLWTLAVSLFSRHLEADMLARVLGVMGLISIGFLVFILFTSNPFDRVFPAAANGHDLNPQLQDPGLIVHPPLLYMGYVGMAVPFGFAMAALLAGRLDTAWARWTRPWATAAWCFLTLGIALGSAWAYYELGWGGWWFWDPVENASLMPWLVVTALLHSLAVTEKRDTFKMWTVLLAIIAFSLSLLGTFLVRSGVLTSVHAFATDPKRGIFILLFLAIVVGGSFLLFALRAAQVGIGGRFAAISRESLLLGNNVLLMVAAASVMLGTLYPLIIDALGMGKLSVGPPYFNAVFVPLIAPALFLMGVGPIAHWQKADPGRLTRRLRWALGVSLVAALVAPFCFGDWAALTSFGYFLGFWIFASALVNLLGRLRMRPLREAIKVLRVQPGSYYGMLIAHVGMGVVVIGITTVNSYEEERDVIMRPSEIASIAGYTFRLDSIAQRQGPNYVTDRAVISAFQDGRRITVLMPERRIYTAAQSSSPMTEAAINTRLTRDLYVALGDPMGDGSWIVRLYFKPFVAWIWGGGILMALGGGLAVMDRRYRRRSTIRSDTDSIASRAQAYPTTQLDLGNQGGQA